MNDISVSVFRPAGRKFYVCQWRDPATGRKKTRSTGTSIRRDADRFAGRLASEISEGKHAGAARVTWEAFRKRYEKDHISKHEGDTPRVMRSNLDCFETKMRPTQLSAITTATIVEYRGKLDALAPATVRTRLRGVQAALNWAKNVDMVAVVPRFEVPKGSHYAGGRPLNLEEFEKLCLIGKSARGQSWVHLLSGLWLSGLRIGESMKLRWNDGPFHLDFDGHRPMFQIHSTVNKSKRTERFPMAPEFFDFLMETPLSQREGFVFNPIGKHGKRVGTHCAQTAIIRFGQRSGIKTVEKTRGQSYASAHDLRRSFGSRWAKRVMPAVLQRLMRHADISTTMTYYATDDDDAVADSVWQAVANTSANTSPAEASETLVS